MPTLYRWKVLEDNSPWKMKGKVLKHHMTEEEARAHERSNARVLEKVPGSEWTPAPVGQGWSTP